MKLLLQIFKTLEKSEFRVLIKHCFLMGKIIFKKNSGLISVIRTLLRWKQWVRGGYWLSTQSYRHKYCWTLRLPKFSSCPGKHQKTPQILFGRSLIEVAWDNRVEDIKRQRIHHFEWTFVNVKAVFKVGAAFAHCRFKTTTRRRFRALFATVSTQEKKLFRKYVTMHETWIHDFYRQISASKLLASVFCDVLGILFIDSLKKGRTINSENYITLFVHFKEVIAKKRPQMKNKKCSFTKTMHCVTSQSQRWPNYIQKNATGKEIWLQWRSTIRQLGVFWGQIYRSTKEASNC